MQPISVYWPAPVGSEGIHIYRVSALYDYGISHTKENTPQSQVTDTTYKMILGKSYWNNFPALLPRRCTHEVMLKIEIQDIRNSFIPEDPASQSCAGLWCRPAPPSHWIKNANGSVQTGRPARNPGNRHRAVLWTGLCTVASSPKLGAFDTAADI